MTNTALEIASWIANILAVVGWLINIRWRKRAMIIFTVATLISIVYFGLSGQTPFFIRHVIYLAIDVATLVHICRHE